MRAIFDDENSQHEGLTAGQLGQHILNYLFSKSHRRRGRKPKGRGKAWPDFRDAGMVAKLLEYGWTEANGTRHGADAFISRAWNMTNGKAYDMIVEELTKAVANIK